MIIGNFTIIHSIRIETSQQKFGGLASKKRKVFNKT